MITYDSHATDHVRSKTGGAEGLGMGLVPAPVVSTPLWRWSYECFCPPIGHHCWSARFDFRWHYSFQERSMKILNILPRLPSCTAAHSGGKVASAVTRSCRHCSLNSNSHGCHMACVLIGMSCKQPPRIIRADLNEAWVQADRNGGCPGIHRVRIEPATRSVVSIWLIN